MRVTASVLVASFSITTAFCPAPAPSLARSRPMGIAGCRMAGDAREKRAVDRFWAPVEKVRVLPRFRLDQGWACIWGGAVTEARSER